MVSEVGWGSPLEIVGLSRRVTIRGVAVEMHTAIRASSPRLLQRIHERASADILVGDRHGALTDGNDMPPHANRCDLSTETINFYVQQARSTNFQTLLDRPSQSPVLMSVRC